MKKLLLSLFACLLAVPAVAGEDMTISEVATGVFSPRGVSGMNPLADGETFARIEDGKRIVAYSFKTGEQTAVLFDADNTKGSAKVNGLDGYLMSPDERNILIRTQTKSIYRRSYTAVYYIYNVRNHTLEPLSDGGPQETPRWSPDGTMVGFVREGNLFIVKLLFDNAEV